MLHRPSAERDAPSARLPLAAASRTWLGAEYEPSLELWLLRLADVAAPALDTTVLDQDERRRAAALTRPGDRLGYLAAHLLLRQLLGARMGLEPAHVSYRRQPCPGCGGPHGRPAVDRSPGAPHFSIASSGGLVVVGVAAVQIGVDIEALPEREIVDDVSALLHPEERREICSAASGEQVAVFTRLWTRKEAYLKGIGLGVATDLAAGYLGTHSQAAAPHGWTIVDVPVPAGYGAAVAIQDTQ